MFLEDVKKLDRDSLLSEDVLRELFGVDDAYLMEKYRQELVARAAELKCKTDFNRLYQAYRKEVKKANLQFSDKPSNITEFSEQPTFRCGSWVATEEGVYILQHDPVPNVFYIRNHDMGCDYEVALDLRGYNEVVFGVVPERIRKPPKKMRMDDD